MWLACSERWLQRPASASRFSRPGTESLDCTTVFGGARPNGGLSVPDHDNNDKLVRSRVNLIEPMIKSTTVETLPRSSLPFDTSFLFFFFQYRELDRSRIYRKSFDVEIVSWRLMFFSSYEVNLLRRSMSNFFAWRGRY